MDRIKIYELLSNIYNQKKDQNLKYLLNIAGYDSFKIENTIPEKEILNNILEVKLTSYEINEIKIEIKIFLNILINNNIIKINKKNKVFILNKNQIHIAHLQKSINFGFGIVEGKDYDFYLKNVNSYMDKDIVMIIEESTSDEKSKSDSARIIGLIEHIDKYFMVKRENNGTLKFLNDNQTMNQEIKLIGIDLEQIQKGSIFSVTIEDITKKYVYIKFLNFITDQNDPDKLMKIILYKYEIDVEFPKEINDDLLNIEEEISNYEISKRIDLRQQVFFTIDGSDSKDLDDAISLIKEGKNYRLFVSIADVSAYIKANSKLDEVVKERSTSVYFIDRVVPMIPKKISNGICSLHEKVDRLTMTCEMLINIKGEVIEKKIYQSVINSKHRLTYNNINKIIENSDRKIIETYKDIYGIILEMNKLSKILRKKRLIRGAFNLEDTDSKFTLNDEQKIINIEPVHRGDSEKLIEEFMIVANETVTEFVDEKSLPFLYRVHGNPNNKKLLELKNILAYLKINVDLDYDNFKPSDFKKIMDNIENDIFKRIISKIVVRSMAKAVYSSVNIGHFGLASKHYTHFTSPIRRYPDLMVHRLLKMYTDNNFQESEKNSNKYVDIIEDIAAYSSDKEVKAQRAEQEIEDYKKAEYMEKFIGSKFIGTITSIEDYGIFLELENTVRGLVRFRSLLKVKEMNKYKIIFFNGLELKFGDQLEIMLVGVRLERGLVDFIPANKQYKNEEPIVKIKQNKFSKNKKENKRTKFNKKDKFNKKRKRNK